MICSLILDEMFEFDEDYVIEQIQNAYLEGSACRRLGGIRYKKNDDNTTEILAWQCNLADVQNYEVKLPTIVRISLDENNIVTNVNLNNYFKGSQGIPCSQKYLNKRLKKLVIGQDYDIKNSALRSQTALHCRHIYELVYGACSFKDYCIKNNLNDAYVSESTSAVETEKGLSCVDNISINNKKAITKIEFNNFKGNMKYNVSGAIESVSGMEIVGYYLDEDEWIKINDNQLLEVEGNEKYIMTFMKKVSPYWQHSGSTFNLKKKFYFSQIWPTTLFGILTQAFGLTTFNKNYAYFQHCIAGIQSIDQVPYCIGGIKTLDEGEKYFDNFSVEDLY